MPGPRKEGEPARIETPTTEPKIIKTYNFQELEDKIRHLPLLDNAIKGLYPYLQSEIYLENVSLDKLQPSARYVLEQNLSFQGKLRSALATQGIDTLQMTEEKAATRFSWGSSSDTIVSPIIEVSQDDGGLFVVTDGLHRVMLAKMLGLEKINAIVIRKTAVPLSVMPVAWDEVEVVEKVPALSKKRKLRFPDAKDAFRWFGMTTENLERVVGGLFEPDSFGYRTFFRDLDFDKQLSRRKETVIEKELVTTSLVGVIASNDHAGHTFVARGGTRLQFGKPIHHGQALIRLPTPSHPKYPSDEVIEHLGNFRTHFDRLHFLSQNDPQEFNEFPLESRFVPLSIDDLTVLESLSFKRVCPALVIKEHEALMEKTKWLNLFPSGDEEYGWWEVYEMTPELEIPDHSLTCIMYNSYQGGQGFPPRYHRLSRDNWIIEIGLVNGSELELLLSELRRF